MARSRNIKPGFFSNDELAELPALTRLLFIGLWTIADRDGRVEDRPKKIKAETLPYDECDADDMLQALHKLGFILRYTAAGIRCIQIINWAKHQNPHVKEQASTMQAPDMSGATAGQAQAQEKPCPEDAGLIPSLLIPDSSPLIPDSLGSGAKAPRADRGTRLPKDWALPKAWGEWALAEYPHWDVDVVRKLGTGFGNHWKAKSGKDATKLDWELTWQNWCSSDITQRAYPIAGRQFQTAKERDTAAAVARVREMTGGLLNGEFPPDDNIIEMESRHAAQIGNR